MKKPETLGQRIAQARRELAVRLRRDVTLADLAEAADVTPGAVSLWEADKRPPREEAIQKLAKFLGTTPEWLRYARGDRITVAGVEIDRATVRQFTEEELAEATRIVAERDAQKAARSPKRRKRGNDR